MASAARSKPVGENQLYKAGNSVGIKALIADFVVTVLLSGMVAPVGLGTVKAVKPYSRASTQELKTRPPFFFTLGSAASATMARPIYLDDSDTRKSVGELF